MDAKEKQIGAGYFKQHCLAIIDEVAETHQPMVRLVPVAADEEIESHILQRLRVDEKTFLEPSSWIAGWSDT